MSELWQRIRAARKSSGLSQEALGKKCSPPISKNAVSLWETANAKLRTKPKYENLQVISKETGASIEWLLSDDSDLPTDRHGEAGGKPPPSQEKPITDEMSTGVSQSDIDNLLNLATERSGEKLKEIAAALAENRLSDEDIDEIHRIAIYLMNKKR